MSLDRRYEKFKGGPTVSPRERIHITLDGQGRLFMNRNAHLVFGKPKAVYLYYNREEDTIALEPSNPRLPESFPVVPKMTGWVINVAPFCRHFNLKPEKTERFVRPDIDAHGIIHLDLKNTVTVRANRRKKGK